MSEAKAPREDIMAKSRAAVDAAKADTSGKVYRVYCDGIFDMFHLGHMRMLEQAKKSLGDPAKVWLIAGVCDDVMTQKFKGKVVMNHTLRCDSVRHCKWVDEVAPDAPWVINDEFMTKYRIDFVAHDALPYKDISGASEDGDVYNYIKRQGKFLETQRTEGISTSDLIVMIVRDYDEYVRRNLDRGYTKDQLNVGRTWEIRAVAHEKNRQLQQSLAQARKQYDELSEALKLFVRRFGPRPSELDFKFAPNPHELVNGNGNGNGNGHDGGDEKDGTESDHESVDTTEDTTRCGSLKDLAYDVVHHGWGFAHSLVAAGYFLGACCNPFSYCPRDNSKKKKN
jgi:choline-phosphate cytidylyltransferase